MGIIRERQFPSIPVSILTVFVLLAGLSFAGYQSLFSSFAAYDDEGYVMISLQSFLDGHPLYDATYSQYGPAYYQISGLFHRLSQLPISHDVVRFKTLFVWLVSALLAGTIVWQISKNRWIAIATVPVVFFHLDRFGLEPAHPQELCVALTMICLSLAIWFDQLPDSQGLRTRLAALSGFLGLLVGIILMIKINLGVFLILSFALALLTASSRSKLTRSFLWSCFALTLVMPVALMKNHFVSLAGIQLPLLIISSTIIASLACRRIPAPENRSGFKLIACFAVAVFGCVAIICRVAISQGTSLAGLLDGVILQHTDGLLFQNAPLFVAFSLPCVLLSGWCAWNFRQRPHAGIQKWIDIGVFVLLVCLIFRQFTDSFMPIRHGGDDRSLALLLTSVVTPFAWIVLIPLYGHETDLKGVCGFGRLALCFVAVLQPLQSFPIPGTQVALGSICLVLILLIAASDAINRGLVFRSLDNRRVGQLVKSLATVVLLLIVVRGATGFHYRSNCVPLELPGASRMRLPQERTEQIRWIVSELNRDNLTFLGAPNGYPSFYFWSNQAPPTYLNATYWPALLSADQQKQVVLALASHEQVAVLAHRDSGNWQSLDTPLVHYLKNEFEPAKQRGSHQIWQRKPKLLSRPQFGMNSQPKTLVIRRSCGDSL